jgi:hypothetical protein
VKLPGLTTARLQLALAAMCLATLTLQGLAAAALVLTVLAARLLVIGQLARHRATPAASVRADLSLAGPLS